MNNRRSIEYTSKLELIPDETETIFFVPESDWKRYKNKVSNLKCKGTILHTIGSILLGVSGASALGIITIPTSNVTLCLLISVFTLISGIFLLILASEKRKAIHNSSKGILDEMEYREPKYKKAIQKEARETKIFDNSQELDLNSLQLFMDTYFPERAKSPIKDKKALLNEIKLYGETIKSLKEKYKITRIYIDDIENEIFQGKRKFMQHQVVRNVILDLTNNGYWERRKKEQRPNVVQLKEKIRQKLDEKITNF